MVITMVKDEKRARNQSGTRACMHVSLPYVFQISGMGIAVGLYTTA